MDSISLLQTSHVIIVTALCLIAAALFQFNPARKQPDLTHSISYFSCFFIFWSLASLCFNLRHWLPVSFSVFTTNLFLFIGVYSLYLGFKWRISKARHLYQYPFIVAHIIIYTGTQTFFAINGYNDFIVRAYFYTFNYAVVLAICLPQVNQSARKHHHYGEKVTAIIIKATLLVLAINAACIPYFSIEEAFLAIWAISLIAIMAMMGAIQTLLLADETERHYQNSITDSLTGLFNRRHFLQLQDVTMKSANRHHFPFTIVMCDLDHFKKINDTYGHQCGDQLLIECANALQTLCRDSDILARYGGEEFIILLPQTDSKGAQNLAERMRSAIANINFDFQGHEICMTASFGISSHEHFSDLDLGIKQADKALYQAKKGGRNNTCTFNENSSA
ncbi:GGDEF domain-containing protein [Thalassotalea atypica]|uniref:GGDEF domain-containing protein n=1 Tax=Thalassotalea atypica TaxID=2054316 RepID=UPI00257256F8|nr:GGDEF domain-containing protein [Thalassotalea atypica]